MGLVQQRMPNDNPHHPHDHRPLRLLRPPRLFLLAAGGRRRQAAARVGAGVLAARDARTLPGRDDAGGGGGGGGGGIGATNHLTRRHLHGKMAE